MAVYDDEYTGERFTYYSPLRPIAYSLIPKECEVVIKPSLDSRTVITTNPLPDDFISQWSLEVR